VFSIDNATTVFMLVDFDVIGCFITLGIFVNFLVFLMNSKLFTISRFGSVQPYSIHLIIGEHFVGGGGIKSIGRAATALPIKFSSHIYL
jgi:hypothetical protein